MNPLDRCGHPSPVVKVDLPMDQGAITFEIPKKEIFRVRNIFEAHEYAVPATYIPSGQLTIVDIGANVGLFALYTKGVVRKCDIFCFEPAPLSFKLLEQNTRTCNGIHIFPYALSDHDGVGTLHLHPCNSGENSFKPTDQNKPTHSIQVKVKDGAGVFRSLGLTYIDILKIDTEGCEVEILNSLKPFLPYTGIVMIEYHCDTDRRDIDRILHRHRLFDANIASPQIGLLKYINGRLL